METQAGEGREGEAWKVGTELESVEAPKHSRIGYGFILSLSHSKNQPHSHPTHPPGLGEALGGSPPVGGRSEMKRE